MYFPRRWSGNLSLYEVATALRLSKRAEPRVPNVRTSDLITYCLLQLGTKLNWGKMVQ